MASAKNTRAAGVEYSTGDDQSRNLISSGELILDCDAKMLWRFGRMMRLSAKSFLLLRTLMKAPGREFNRSELIAELWGTANAVDERTVDVEIGRLRKSINRGNAVDPIVSVRGRGYKFDEYYSENASEAAPRLKLKLK